MAAIPCYYSSDDDVSWGPRTLREIKRDLKRKVRPKRRHSDHRCFTSSHRLVASKENLDHQDMCELLDSNNITENPSQYFTANETKRSSIVDNNARLPLASNQDYNDNCQITLANSFYDLNISTKLLNHVCPNNSVISISDDDSEYEVETSILVDEKLLETIKTEPGQKKENEKRQNEDALASNKSFPEDYEISNCNYNKSENWRLQNHGGCSEKDEFADDCEGTEKLSLPLDGVIVNTIKAEPRKYTENYVNHSVDSLSDTEIEDNETTGYTNGAERTDREAGCEELNTTLDDIERLLKGDLSSLNKVISSPHGMASTSNLKESKIPVPKTPQMIKTTDGFKVPQPAVSMLLTPKLKGNLKNIVSPVGLYIKYSPQAALFRKNIQNTNSAHVSTKLYPVNRYKHINLPEVIYKPSKKPIVIPRKNLFMPPSIEKMVQEPVCIKHEKKSHAIKDANHVKLLLSMDGNLTDESTCDEVNDSIHVNKHVFK